LAKKKENRSRIDNWNLALLHRPFAYATTTLKLISLNTIFSSFHFVITFSFTSINCQSCCVTTLVRSGAKKKVFWSVIWFQLCHIHQFVTLDCKVDVQNTSIILHIQSIAKHEQFILKCSRFLFLKTAEEGKGYTNERVNCLNTSNLRLDEEDYPVIIPRKNILRWFVFLFFSHSFLATYLPLLNTCDTFIINHLR